MQPLHNGYHLQDFSGRLVHQPAHKPWLLLLAFSTGASVVVSSCRWHPQHSENPGHCSSGTDSQSGEHSQLPLHTPVRNFSGTYWHHLGIVSSPSPMPPSSDGLTGLQSFMLFRETSGTYLHHAGTSALAPSGAGSSVVVAGMSSPQAQHCGFQALTLSATLVQYWAQAHSEPGPRQTLSRFCSGIHRHHFGRGVSTALAVSLPGDCSSGAGSSGGLGTHWLGLIDSGTELHHRGMLSSSAVGSKSLPGSVVQPQHCGFQGQTRAETLVQYAAQVQLLALPTHTDSRYFSGTPWHQAGYLRLTASASSAGSASGGLVVFGGTSSSPQPQHFGFQAHALRATFWQCDAQLHSEPGPRQTLSR
mmetsp:Transcript_45191/g.144262  ORF Transcript_45191/g.144262 Transcript_45191/m.144262 type:complete len:361 (+) Transcript_45191:1017-2099(+)